jgi:RNA 3'-phosphate cyclase
MGIDTRVSIGHFGFYPRGGGQATLTVNPGELKSINLTDPGSLKHFDMFSLASTELQNPRVADRQAEAAKSSLSDMGKPVHDTSEYSPTQSPGSSIFAGAHFDNSVLGATSLGKRGKPAQEVGSECAGLLKQQIDSGACLDKWMADQILPYMALSGKPSQVSVSEITNHARTSIWLIEQFLPVKFRTEPSGSHFIISSEPG